MGLVNPDARQPPLNAPRALTTALPGGKAKVEAGARQASVWRPDGGALETTGPPAPLRCPLRAARFWARGSGRWDPSRSRVARSEGEEMGLRGERGGTRDSDKPSHQVLFSSPAQPLPRIPPHRPVARSRRGSGVDAGGHRERGAAAAKALPRSRRPGPLAGRPWPTAAARTAQAPGGNR